MNIELEYMSSQRRIMHRIGLKTFGVNRRLCVRYFIIYFTEEKIFFFCC